MNIKPHDFEALASGIYLEGLAVDVESGWVWFSDVVGGGIHGLHADGSRTVFDRDRMWTGGVLLNDDGAVLSSGQGGVRWHHPQSGRSGWLITELAGEPVNGINEMMPDGRGGMFFGTCDIASVIEAKSPRSTEIWHLAADGKIRRVWDDIGFANGIMYDAERQRLYCNDSFDGTWVFDVDADLCLHNRTRFTRKTDVDGMALDADGNVWITGFASSAIDRYTPQGQALEPLETPGGAVTQLRFAGHDMRDLYINTVPADGGASIKEGRAMVELKSVLYRTRVPMPGRAVGTTSFNLCESHAP